MNKFILQIILICFMCAFSKTHAQVIESPTYGRSDSPSMRIDRVERNPNETILFGTYTNVQNYGWANIRSMTRIRDCQTGKLYYLRKSEGLPMSPDSHKFSSTNESLDFKLSFPTLDKNTKLIDLIEDEYDPQGFNIYEIAVADNVRREFKIKSRDTHTLPTKPLLTNRLSGVKVVQLYVPTQMTKFSNYIYTNFNYYLNSLGVKTEVVRATFETKSLQVGTLQGFSFVFKDQVSDYWNTINSLGVVINYTYAVGQYTSSTHMEIAFVDYINDYIWRYSIDVPNKSNKFQKRLRKEICSQYNYNSMYSFVPYSLESNWSPRIMRGEIEENKNDSYEGIYRGDKYTLGVKKDNHGNYYLLYFDGANNINDWKVGDVKATLSSTATPGLFFANWYGQWKQKMRMKILFSRGVMTTIDEDKDRETFIKTFPTATMKNVTKDQHTLSSGSGFFLTKKGYIVTNHHVVAGAHKIKVSGVNDDYKTSYTAKVEVSDTQNDIAILKIDDPTFKPIKSIPYSLKFRTSSVGEDCFVLGYPLVSTMGLDIKLTNGIISSRTGFKGHISEYQISAPIQPGNSGGPLFDKDGYVIGVVVAKHTQAENAGYAVKANYIRNLIELLPEPATLPKSNLMVGKSLPYQVKLASKAVCIVVVEK